jgi:hypothetical protein
MKTLLWMGAVLAATAVWGQTPDPAAEGPAAAALRQAARARVEQATADAAKLADRVAEAEAALTKVAQEFPPESPQYRAQAEALAAARAAAAKADAALQAAQADHEVAAARERAARAALDQARAAGVADIQSQILQLQSQLEIASVQADALQRQLKAAASAQDRDAKQRLEAELAAAQALREKLLAELDQRKVELAARKDAERQAAAKQLRAAQAALTTEVELATLLAQAEKQRAEAQAREELARVTLAREQQLVERGLVSAAQLDQARLDLEKARAALRAAQARAEQVARQQQLAELERAQAEQLLATARAALDRQRKLAKARAPFRQLVDLGLDDVPVADAIKQLVAKAAPDLTVAIAPDLPADLRVTLRVPKVQLATALDLLTQAAGVSWWLEQADGKTTLRIGKEARPSRRSEALPAVASDAYPDLLATFTNRAENLALEPAATLLRNYSPEERATFTCPQCKQQATVVRTASQPKCPKCSRLFEAGWQFCPVDGARRPAAPTAWKFCPHCGQPIGPEKPGAR